ncbi:MAG: DUF2339 domain-containing protein, partial [Pseudanabaena sp. SU_2_4]|nr:DUF2339 domain-containing protein [Pseudanabaena sp. SU_2_4]
GALLLTIYAALRLFGEQTDTGFVGLISPRLAFALMLLVVGIGAVLAVLQDAVWLALFAAAGGFAAPILASSGQGSHVQLFSYYLVLNFGILAIAISSYCP